MLTLYFASVQPPKTLYMKPRAWHSSSMATTSAQPEQLVSSLDGGSRQDSPAHLSGPLRCGDGDALRRRGVLYCAQGAGNSAIARDSVPGGGVDVCGGCLDGEVTRFRESRPVRSYLFRAAASPRARHLSRQESNPFLAVMASQAALKKQQGEFAVIESGFEVYMLTRFRPADYVPELQEHTSDYRVEDWGHRAGD